MILTIEERELFWKNWLNLMAFVNDTYKIDKEFAHPTSPVGINLNAGLNISNKIFSNITIIDKFVNTNRIIGEDKELLLSWKGYIKSTFIVLKQLKKYCILYDEENNKWYGVNGITDSIEETIQIQELPCLIRTVLIPFKNKIIYNSFMENYNVILGNNIRRELTEKYKRIKIENKIIDKL
jgi:hypothetical protein